MKFTDALLDATNTVMDLHQKSVVFGLGVTDPKAIFGTTAGLKEKYGNSRVFDMPLAENSMTGLGIGMALSGYKVLFIHQRLDFYLLAMDQLVNNAAKWHMMFGGKNSVNMTIRLIIGRGWGQGPTHSQALHSWFAHIPGLKVVVPSNPRNAKGLLVSAMLDPNPVLFIEHRWLHNSEGEVPPAEYKTPIGSAEIVREGSDITIIASSLMVPEGIRALEYMKKKYRVEGELLDLQSIRPIDWDKIFRSVEKTRRLLVLDFGHEMCSIASEILARVAMEKRIQLRANPNILGLPNYATPTSFELTKSYYPDTRAICMKIADALGLDIDPNCIEIAPNQPHDIPGSWFNGPF